MDDADATNAVTEVLPAEPAWRLAPGDRVRDWVLEEVIGHGGSSVVFAATRRDGDFAQHAAVKLLRPVWSDERFLAHFERERRILQDLADPRIVRLLDGGQMADGSPWYAMERVDGEPLTTWGRRQPLRARLEALIEVARAVAHAHQRLVVHCDLKPENVLVDRGGKPRLLDFGIARLVGEDERTGTLRMATPRWAAPEQLQGGALSTATDVYALGLLLWALLTGEEPRGEVSSALGMLTASQHPLPPPSGRTPVARGDLDAIVLRATASDPADRYVGASDFADDVLRHLRGEAVRAREGVAWYLVSRWARTHKGWFAAGLAGALLLVGWAVTSGVQARQVRAERDRAEATLDLLLGMLEAADPAEARGEALTVQEVLERGVQQLDEDLSPEVVGPVRLAAGRVQLATGALDDAEDSLRRAMVELETALGPEHPLTLRAERLWLSASFGLQPAGRLTGVPRLERLIERMHAAGAQREAALATMELAEAQLELGDHRAGRNTAAEARERLLEVGEREEAARALAIHGYLLAHQGEQVEGQAEMAQALEETVAAVGTRQHPAVADILHELAMAHRPVDLALFEESVALRRALYGRSFKLAAALSNQALALDNLGQPEPAIELLREAAGIAAEARGPDHSDALGIQANLGAMLDDAGHDEEARVVLERVVAAPATTAPTRERSRVRLDALSSPRPAP